MQKTVIFSLLLAGWAGVAGVANAQERARVLSATPIVQQVGVPRQVCGVETVHTGPRTSGGGALLGAIAGGAAGNAIGGGSGRAAATALGVIGGAVLGNHIEGNGRPEYENVQRCTTETFYENRTVGYNVTYEYAGRQYTTRTQTDPGAWISVSVQPLHNSSGAGQTYSTIDPYAPESAPYPVQPLQPVYVNPPVTVIEYNSEPYYPPPRPRPHWR